MTWWAIDIRTAPERRDWMSAWLEAIASVRLGPARAVGIENDGEANQVAVRNVDRNGVRHRVEFLDGDAGDLAPLLGPADLPLANILRTIHTAWWAVAARRP